MKPPTSSQPTVISIVLMLSLCGCELFTDYEAIGTGIEPTSIQDAGPDAADANLEDVASDASTEEDVSPSDMSVVDASDSDGGTVERCPTDQPNYVVRPASELSGGAMIDGDCSEFSTIAPLPIPPPETTNGSPINASDNIVDCRLVWQPTSPTRIHGCCQVTDDSIVAEATPSDPFGQMTDNPDDRIEYNFKCDRDRSTYACARKFFINALMPEPTVVERIYRTQSDRDERFPEHVESAAVATAGGYVLEWEGEIGFDASPGSPVLFSLALFDMDEGAGDDRIAEAFGPINDIEDWACCEFDE